ncbi:MAG: Mth938-like domain-containing protein [Telluria sp.]
MKLHQSTNQAYQTVTGYDDRGVEINAVRFEHSLLVMPEQAPERWEAGPFASLAAADFEAIAARAPDLVILGTGARQRFVHPRLVAALAAQRIGVECMDNKAACRTYNILMGEGRRVLLALLLDPADLA